MDQRLKCKKFYQERSRKQQVNIFTILDSKGFSKHEAKFQNTQKYD